jgi:hypothetical protein
MTCGPSCDHFNGTRTYEGNWGLRSKRFCPDSTLPTRRELLAAEFDAIVEDIEPRRHFRLAGGPELPTLVTEVSDAPA